MEMGVNLQIGVFIQTDSCVYENLSWWFISFQKIRTCLVNQWNII